MVGILATPIQPFFDHQVTRVPAVPPVVVASPQESLTSGAGVMDRNLDTVRIRAVLAGSHGMTAPHPGQTEVVPVGVRRFGYTIAVGLSLGILFIVNNLPTGDEIPFLTSDFERLLPIINALLLTSIVVYGVWILYDAPWFRSAGRIILNLLIIAVLGLTYRVFPFDFSAYDFDWATLIRVLIIGALIAFSIATIVEVVKLISRFLDY